MLTRVGVKMIILKIGGSIITEKDSKEPKVDYKNLNRICNEIKESFSTENINADLMDGLVIVHGAGSFGHPPASEYKIGQPFPNEEFPEKRIGFAKTQSAVKELNTYICNALIEHGLPAVSMQVSSFVTTSDKRIYDFDLEFIKNYLNNGFIPVLYGDPVLDEKYKMAILSGDQILQYIARFLVSDRVVLGTDVDGVYDKNPKTHDDAKLIEEVSSIEEIIQVESTTNIDVTGGMVGKVNELLSLAEIGVDSEIINANRPGAIGDALQNKKVKGTKITKK